MPWLNQKQVSLFTGSVRFDQRSYASRRDWMVLFEKKIEKDGLLADICGLLCDVTVGWSGSVPKIVHDAKCFKKLVKVYITVLILVNGIDHVVDIFLRDGRFGMFSK